MNDKNNLSDVNGTHRNYAEEIIILLKKYIGVKVFLAAVAVIMIGIILILFSHGRANTSWQHLIFLEIGKSLLITALISLPVRWFLIKQSEQITEKKNKIIIENMLSKYDEFRLANEDRLSLHDKTILETIKSHDECVQNEIEKISYSSSSLIALSNVYVSRIYEKRTEAGEDIIEAIQSNDNDNIQIIGISLNDITRDEDTVFHKIWKFIDKLISDEKENRKIRIRILLIDPSSEGAFLRAESEEIEGRPSRLYKDVWASMENFQIAKIRSKTNIDFDVRIYRTPPILFMIRTNSVSFVQQYYFRPSHEANVSIPILRFYKPDISEKRSVHDELENHFDWIWKSASVSIDDYIIRFNRGIFRACKDANITNIYFQERLKEVEDNEKSRIGRLLYLIGETKHRLWIKGITLNSYFSMDSELYKVIKKICLKKDIDVRILLLDPNCEQANIRSFKEFLLKHKESKLSDFNTDERERERLYREANVTIDNIVNGLLPSLPNDAIENIKIGFYSSAPEAFLLLTDDYVLVEQYHYGQIVADTGILGGNVPLIEYKNCGDGIYTIFEDHFNYVYSFWTDIKELKKES
jgi:hypothetical protein